MGSDLVAKNIRANGIKADGVVSGRASERARACEKKREKARGREGKRIQVGLSGSSRGTAWSRRGRFGSAPCSDRTFVVEGLRSPRAGRGGLGGENWLNGDVERKTK